MLRKLLFLLFSLVTIVAMGQTAQTKKQSLPEQPGFELQDGTVYTVDKTMTLDGNSTGGFINGLKVADGATVTLYIPAGVTLTVIGQSANIKDAGGNVIESQKGAGAGIYVPASSTLYITGEGTLIAKGGDGGDGGNGTSGTKGTVAGSSAVSGRGGDGGNGGGGGGAAIGGNGGDGGAATVGALESQARKRKGTTGANGNPMMPTSTEYNGKDGSNGNEMGNVYILGSVTVQTTLGGNGTSGGKAGTHGEFMQATSGNVTLSAGGGGAGAGGGAGIGALYGIGGGGAGAGGGAAGASGAADRYDGKNLTFNDDNMKGAGGSATGAGEGAVNGSVITTGDMVRDNGADTSGRFPRYGGYGGSVGGKAGTQGGNGAVYVEQNSETDLTGATIGNKIVMSADAEEIALSALNVDIKLNFLNDGEPNSGVLNAKFGEPYEQLPDALVPSRPGYDFIGYYTQAVDGTPVFDKDGKPTPEGTRCLYVQEENPTLYAHWILSTYTITWKYDYYSVDQQSMVSVPENERSTQAIVIIRLTDGNTHTMTMTNPTPSATETTYTVTLRNVLSDEIFNKVVSVEKVEPVDVEGAANALMTLDYVSESSAKIFYDPTRYMVKWNVTVDATEKPEYIILTVKRGTSDATADGDIPTEDDYKEDANIFRELRIRKNANGTYSGSAVLMYEHDASTPFHYSVSVVGVRDDSGHDYIFPSAVSSSMYKEGGIMYCSKPTEQNPTPQKNIEQITMTLELKKLAFDPNGGTLNDGSPENIWAPTNTTVSLKSGETSYPYTATRLNYNFEGWATTENATEGLDNITLDNDNTVYAVFMDRTPPTITFGDYTRNGSGDNYRVPVTISDAVSTQNVVYYTVYTTDPGVIDVNDSRWGTQKGKTQKKAEVVNIDFNTTSVVYVHVKAVDESGNAAVASKEIKVDNEAPIIHAYPNVDSFCAVDVDVDVTDNVKVTSLKIDGVAQTISTEAITSLVLNKPTSGSKVYTITASDAAGNETVRNITIYAKHNFEEGTMIQAIEPTASSEGYYRYKKCAQCSHIILLRGNTETQIDITDEAQRGAWIIPAGAVMLMTPYNDAFDIVDYDTYVNTALTKTNTVTSATQVRLSKDTQLASNSATSLVTPNRSIDLELNGHGLMTGNNSTGDITGNGNVTILLTDNGTLPYTNESSVTADSPVKYVRTFSSVQGGNWQALYVPFTITNVDGAELGNIKLATVSGDVTTLEVEKKENGFTPNTNYFVKHAAGTMTMTGSGLVGKNLTTKDLGDGYSVAASLTNEDNVATADKAYWVVTNGGKFTWAKAGSHQRPYRWVVYTGSGQQQAKTMTFVFVEAEPTAIDNIKKSQSFGNIYSIDGRKVQEGSALHPGIYIRNGKKFVVR